MPHETIEQTLARVVSQANRAKMAAERLQRMDRSEYPEEALNEAHAGMKAAEDVRAALSALVGRFGGQSLNRSRRVVE